MIELILLMGDEGGATAVEYALIATLISVSAIFGMSALGVSLADMFTLVAKSIDGALKAAGVV